MDINQLRNEYRILRTQGIAALRVLDGSVRVADENGAYDNLVADELLAQDLPASPENWVAQARVLTAKFGAEATNYENWQYENGWTNDSRDDHMGYDTLEERAMDML